MLKLISILVAVDHQDFRLSTTDSQTAGSPERRKNSPERLKNSPERRKNSPERRTKKNMDLAENFKSLFEATNAVIGSELPITRWITMDIPGPTGALQAELTIATDPGRDFAVLCHPHPQYGGNMHDMVLDCIADVLLNTGISCLRFNFRGVGNSEGVSSGGAEEADDLLAVTTWLKAEHDPENLWLGGYSFGANMAWRTMSVIAPDRLLLVAPPVGLMEFAEQPLTMPVDIFTGDRDDYVDIDKLSSLAGARVRTIAGADHFFMGYHDQLRQSIRDALS